MILLNKHNKTLCTKCGSRSIEQHSADCSWYQNNHEKMQSIKYWVLLSCFDEGLFSEVDLTTKVECPDYISHDECDIILIDHTVVAADSKESWKFSNEDGSSKYAIKFLSYYVNKYNKNIYMKGNLISVRVKDSVLKSVAINGQVAFTKPKMDSLLSQAFYHGKSDFKDWLSQCGLSSCCETNDLLNNYYGARNPVLRDLRVSPLEFFKHVPSRERAKIYAIARKKGTKAAIVELTGASTRPLQSTVIENLEIRNAVKLALGAGLLEPDVIKVTQKYNQAFCVIAFLENMSVGMSTFGYSRKQVINADYRHIEAMLDCKRMLDRLLIQIPEYPIPRVRMSELHAHLLRDFLRIRNIEPEKTLLRKPETPDMSMVQDRLTYWSPNNEKDIIECGVHMNICVGSYGQLINSGHNAVFIVSSPSKKYYGCIEVVNGRLIQAKMYGNALASSSPEFNKSVLGWCNFFHIKHKSCQDINAV